MKKYCFFLLLALFFITPCAQGQTAESAEITSLSGTAEVMLSGAEEYSPAEEGMVLEAGDKIKTQADSSCELSFNEDNSNVVRMSENTGVEVILSGDEKLEMEEGEVFSSVNKLSNDSAFEIRTPTAVSGARGTDWVTKVSEDGTEVEAIDSTPYVRHFESAGIVSKELTLIKQGQATSVKRFERPLPPKPVAFERVEKWKNIKQDVRMRAAEAVIKRQQRPPFDRQDFRKRMQENLRERKQGFEPMVSKEARAPEGLPREGVNRLERKRFENPPGQMMQEKREKILQDKPNFNQSKNERGAQGDDRRVNKPNPQRNRPGTGPRPGGLRR